MDNYSELVRAMADAFLSAVRVLETENAQLRSEKELLQLELDEAIARTDFWEEFMDEKDREEGE